MEADGRAAAEPLIAMGSDLLLLDSGMAAAEKAAICKAARVARESPFVIAIGKNIGVGVDIDGSVRKPTTAADAEKIVDSCIRSQLPTRVLIVDDSSTMRGIVRKILSASKFPLEVADTDDGLRALLELRGGKFEMVFLDCNMPGFDGFEILSELRRLQPHVVVVMMTSTEDSAVAERARKAGASACLKKPFFPADIDALLYRLHKIEPPRRTA
ncbi:MAG TPA: response regulator [Xanthobacteraceae bacterium]|nr:response regulator [Xanthobacteraceae bacterium]